MTLQVNLLFGSTKSRLISSEKNNNFFDSLPPQQIYLIDTCIFVESNMMIRRNKKLIFFDWLVLREVHILKISCHPQQ